MTVANAPDDSDSESLDAARTELRDAVPDAAETMRELLDALERAGQCEAMTQELAEALSTPHVDREYRVEFDVSVR